MRIGGLVGGGGAGMTKSAQDRRVYTPSTRGAVRDRRPGHSSDRTVRGTDRPDHPRTTGWPAWPAPWARPTLCGHRRRAGLPGRGAGAVALQRRAPLAAGGAHPGRAPVPPAAVPARLQPPPARCRLAAGAALRWLADHTPATAELLRL